MIPLPQNGVSENYEWNGKGMGAWSSLWDGLHWTENF